MANKIDIEISGNSDKLNKTIDEIEKRIKGMNELSSGGGASKLAGQYSAGGQDDKADRLTKFREIAAKKNRELLVKDLKKQEDILGKQLKDYTAMENAQKKMIDKSDELTKSLEEQSKLYKEIQQTISTTSDIKESMGDGSGGGGKGPGKLGKLGSMAQSAMGAAGSVGAIANAALEMADFMNRGRGQARAERTSSLAESTYESSNRAVRGDSLNDILFAQEKNKAMKSSMEMGQGQFGINQGKAILKGIAGLGMIVGGLALAIPTGGTSLAAAAMGTAAMAGGTAMMTSGGGEGYEAMFGDMSEIDKKTGQQIMEDYKIKQRLEKNRDPVKTMLKNFAAENASDLVQGIRGSGMSEENFIKDYVQGGGTTGSEDFNFKQRMGMTDTITGSGGGSGAAYGQSSVTALQAQRGLGLTNAGQTMGRLSNYMSDKESESAFVKILGKGVSVGLDGSKYREEQKDYMNQVTAVAQRAGGGEDIIAALMAAGIGDDINRKSVEFAGAGAQTVMDEMSQDSGMIGAQKFRKYGKNKEISKLSRFDQMMLGNKRPEDLELDSEAFKLYYDKYEKAGGDMTAEDFRKEILKENSAAVTSGLGDLSKKRDKIEAQLESGKGEDGKDLTSEQRKLLESESAELYGFMTDKRGPFKKTLAASRALSGFEDKLGVGKDFETDVKKYDQLKSAEMLLNKEGKAELNALGETSAGFKTEKGAMEKMLSGIGQMQRQELKGKDLEGKDLSQIMGDLATNMSSSLDMALSERLDLKNFQAALEDGAKEVVQALMAKITGTSTGKAIKKQTVQESKATVGAGRSMGGPR